MAKNIRRMLAMVLVLCMFISALPMQALAAEDNTSTNTTTNDGVTTSTTTSTTTSNNSSGNTVVTVTFEQTSSGINSSGASVSGNSSGSSTKETDVQGGLVSSNSSSQSTTSATTTTQSGNSQTIETSTTFTQISESTSVNGNTTTTNNTEINTQGNSEETVTQSGNTVQVSGSSSEQSTTTNTNTEVKGEQLLDKNDPDLVLPDEGEQNLGTTADPVIPNPGNWELDPNAKQNEYKKDESTEVVNPEQKENVSVKVDTETGTSIMIQVPSTGEATGSKTVGGINVVENAFKDLPQADQIAIQNLIDAAAADPNNETISIEYTVNGIKITVTATVGEDGKILRDECGNVVQYTVTRESEQVVNLENIHDGKGETPVGNVETTKEGTIQYVKPQVDFDMGGKDYLEEDILDGDGNKVGTKVTETIKNEKGEVIGYKITETTERTPTEYDGDPMAPEKQPDPKDPEFKLPERPVVAHPNAEGKLSASAVVTEIKDESDNVIGYTTVENGVTTTIKVTEAKDDEGNVIGFTTTTLVTDADGNEISFRSDTIYGTEYTYSKSETWDPETQKKYDITVTEIKGISRTDDVTVTTNGVHTNVKDVSQDIYQLVETETGTYFVYEGKVYAVIGNNTIAATDLTGGLTFNQYGNSSATDKDDLRLKYEDTGNYNHTGNSLPDNYPNAAGKWDYDGFGMVSDFEVYESNNKTEHRIRQFKMKDSQGNIRYAYCVELGTNISSGANYGSTGYGEYNNPQTNTNENANPWVGATGTIQQLRSVALNGFWGTDDGLGSLQAVKDLMIRNGLADEAKNLTAGMALTATQVAVWYFGASEADRNKFGSFIYDEQTGEYISQDDFKLENYDSSDNDKFNDANAIDVTKADVINKLRDLLVQLALDAGENGEGKAEVLTQENTFTEAGFVIHDKVVNIAANEDENENNDVYKTDVQFKLDVSTSSFNGDLIVKVYVGNDVVGAGRLAGSSKGTDLIGDVLFDKIYPDSSGVFTIPGLELAENVVIDLKLEGTQHLDDGVYVFENASWQDFISLSKLENTVNFTMQMEFNVTDPGTADVSKNHSSWKETKDVAYKKVENGTQTHTGTETNVVTGERTEIYGTVTIVETEVQKTGTESEWRNCFKQDEDDGYGIFRLNRRNGLVEISEEPIPLATPVLTGDISILWIAVILLSIFGIVAINITGKKNKYESF